MAEIGMYVYVSHQGERQISAFRMSPASGELEKIQDISVTGKAMPMAVSPDRRFLLGAYNPESEGAGRRTGWISVSAIGPHGHVQAPHQVIRTPPKTHSILPDPSNRYAFVASCDGDAMVRYAFDAVTGMFDPNPLPPVHVQPKAGPRHFVFHPNYRFMYLLNEYDGSLYSYGYDARNAALSEIQVSSTVPPEFDKERVVRAADIHLTPDGRWLYASGRHPLTLAIFGVDAVTGRLSPAGHVPVAKEPRGFNIDPFGRYLVAAGLQANSLTSFRIDPETGGLTKLAEYPTGEGPNWIEFVRLP